LLDSIHDLRPGHGRPASNRKGSPDSHGLRFPMCYGPEFVSRDLDLWAYMNGVTLDFSRPGKPTDNALVESFNGKFRAECLNTSWFLSLDGARSKCEAWRQAYNEVRPHSAIGHKAPIEFARASGQLCLP